MKFKQNFLIILILLCMMLLGAGCGREEIVSLEERGDRAFEEKDYRMALQHWMKSVGKGADQADLYHKIGKAHLMFSRIDLAEKYFDQAVTINPLAYEIQKDLVRILLLQGKKKAALEKLEFLKERLEKDSDAFILCGDLFMISTDYLKAEQMYREAVHLDRGNARIVIKLAMCLYQTENGDEAEKLISGIQRQNLAPRDLLLLSDYYFLVRDFIGGEKCIVRALENDPANIMYRIRLCQFYLKTGMRDKARKNLVALEEEYPEDARFKLMLADFFLSELEMDKAELLLKKIENIRESQSEYNMLMGKFWLFKGKNSYAVSHLKTVVDGRPGLLSARYLLGIAYFAGGQTKLAESSFIHALMLDPHHVETLMALAGLHYKNQEYKLANQYLEKVILLAPSNARALMIKGFCLMEQEQDKKAAQEFTKAHFLTKEVASLFFLGKSLESQGKLDTALDIYEDVMDQNPELMDVLSEYTALLVDMGKGKKAGEIVERIIKEEGGQPGLYYMGARVSLELEEYDKARAYLETAMGNNDAPGYIYALLGVVHRKTGDNGKAEDILKQNTEKNPGYAKAWTDLAGFYARTQRKSLAFETLDQAVKKIPDNALIAGNLAWLLLEEGKDFDRALDLARIAYEISSGKVYLMDTLGWAYYYKKAFSQAGWLLAKAEELVPDKGIIKFHLGMLFYRQGKLLEAKEKLKKALEFGLSDEEKSQAVEVLADLETDKGGDVFEGDFTFDPENPLVFPGGDREEDDILEPDWSRTLKE